MDLHSLKENIKSDNETILLKKVKELKLLKEAVENSKLSRNQCCHQRDKKELSGRPGEISKDRFLPHISATTKKDRYKNLKEAGEAKYKAKLQRKIEIMQRLLNEERRKQKEKSSRKDETKKFTGEKDKTVLPSLDLGEKTKTATETLSSIDQTNKDDKADEILEDIFLGETFRSENEKSEKEKEIPEEKTEEEGATKSHDKIKQNQSKQVKKPEAKGRKSHHKQDEKITDIKSEEAEAEEIPPQPLQSMVKHLMNDFELWYAGDSLKSTPELPLDTALTANPTEIIFNFPANKLDAVYHKKLTITNTGFNRVHCGFDDILVRSQMVNYKLTAKPKDIILLWPSSSFTIQLEFSPTRKQDQPIEGKVAFITRRNETKGQYCVPIICQPIQKQNRQEKKEKIIRFKKIKFWEKPQNKILELENPSPKTCCVYLSKILNFKTEKKQKRKINLSEENEENSNDQQKTEMQATIFSVLEELIKNVFDPILLSPQYFMKIPPSGKGIITVQFRPHITATEDSFINKYEARIKLESGKILDIYKIIVEAETEDVPLKISPVILDMQLVIEEGGVQQRTFYVINNDRIPWQVTIKVPKIIQKFVTLSPKYLVVKNGQSSPVCIRFLLECGYQECFINYLDEVLNIIEFPLFIYPLPKKNIKLMPLILPVIAVATESNGIEISPTFINFGSVNTTESAKAEISLSNNSMIPQYYCFLNLPRCVNILPGNGYGRILPREKHLLDILYTPDFHHIGCCATGSKNHVFSLTCTTALSASVIPFIDKEKSRTSAHSGIALERKLTVSPLGGTEFEGISLMEMENLLIEQLNLEEGNKGTSILSTSQASNKLPEETEDIIHIDRLDTLNDTHLPDEVVLQNFSVNDSIINELDNGKLEAFPTSSDSGSVKVTEYTNKQKEYSRPLTGSQWVETDQNNCAGKVKTINCTAHIINPYLEFSSQKVLLPQTPYYSNSIAKITLRERKEDICDCGRVLKHKKFTGIFHLVTDNTSLDIQPRSGIINTGEKVNIFITYNPVLKRRNILSRAKTIREKKIEEHLTEIKSQQVDGKLSKKSAKPSKKTTQNTHDFPMEVTQEDIQSAKEEIFRCLDRRIVNATIMCSSELTLNIKQGSKELCQVQRKSGN